MRLIPAQLPDGGERFCGEEPPELIDVRDVEIEDVGPVRYDLRADLVSTELIVQGALETEARLACRRCGRAFAQRVREPDFRFSCTIHNPHQPVDLTPALRESILLVLPAYPLCRDACRGLCPRCGADLNRGTCRCPPPEAPQGAPFGGLEMK